MPNLSLRLLAIATLTLSIGLAAGQAAAAETDPDGRLFAASGNALADVQQAIDRAGASDRRALVVLGGNWCHDSRALAARLNRSPLAEVIEENYELVFVDVGYLDKGRDVTQQFGVAHFYATPTVFIVDPATGKMINDADRHMWANAYKVNMADSVDYFEKWATTDAAADPAAESAQLQALFAEIDRFEQRLADRVAAGYAVVGPMLEAYKADNAPEDFEARWDELAGLRMAIPGDMQGLRDEAQRRVAAGEDDIRLSFPEYPLLSWESD